MKYKWKVQPETTGRYRSFDTREWPDAFYTDKGESMCASIQCADEYRPCDVKTGNHAPLTLRIADHSRVPWKWVGAKRTFATLAEAKEALKSILKDNSQLMPKEKYCANN